MMRTWIGIGVLALLLVANTVLLGSNVRELRDIATERAGVDAQRRAIDAQHAAIELIGQHMRQWLAGTHRCSASADNYVLQTLTDL